MIENSENQKSVSDDDKLNPFSFIAILLYYPALTFAIRLGFSTYFYLFDHLKGIVVIIGIIVTLFFTVIYVIGAVFIIYLLIQLGDKLYKLIFGQNPSKKSKIENEN